MINWRSQAQHDAAMARAKEFLAADTIVLTLEQLRKIYCLAPESHDGSGGSLEQAVVEAMGWFPGIDDP